MLAQFGTSWQGLPAGVPDVDSGMEPVAAPVATSEAGRDVEPANTTRIRSDHLLLHIVISTMNDGMVAGRWLMLPRVGKV